MAADGAVTQLFYDKGSRKNVDQEISEIYPFSVFFILFSVVMGHFFFVALYFNFKLSNTKYEISMMVTLGCYTFDL